MSDVRYIKEPFLARIISVVFIFASIILLSEEQKGFGIVTLIMALACLSATLSVRESKSTQNKNTIVSYIPFWVLYLANGNLFQKRNTFLSINHGKH
ncbi:hypothetical protein [uncultured Flavobacterium sp.]|uniref:hypothetical protein n=1 Tax=uncultured Flavobacterium sp. TaxID=165435 RepID=UPI001206E921|nr:hypothetical protein [uncultured Flavobacterium sp.]THD31404.1 MAG: hypothetical protein DI588_11640 [Flavobacterium johnsoniae]